MDTSINSKKENKIKAVQDCQLYPDIKELKVTYSDSF